jgi:hypothetical protein
MDAGEDISLKDSAHFPRLAHSMRILADEIVPEWCPEPKMLDVSGHIGAKRALGVLGAFGIKGVNRRIDRTERAL